ncbi:uncharacterized protein LOC113350518 [Papaver somniferum]|uniref:uncharacterized protein LOC113350518 n=1 Tax=Papaver somniferum TaxID=3469 RepID=UPI000E6FE9CA|nr:uncharacterized protein LOC113350518 [Papaver somniferum]
MHCIDPTIPVTLISSSNDSRWKPPAVGVMKYNIDGSFDHDSNKFGTGIVLRDHTGTCLGIKGSSGNGALNPEAVECMEVREALSWAKERNHPSIQIEADAKLVIDSINGNVLLIQWENKNLIKEIKHLISSFYICEFVYVSRDNNQVVDAVAKNVRHTTKTLEIFGEFDPAICVLLEKDHNSS